MKKYIIKTVLVGLLIAFTGCSEEYFQVNEPSGSASYDEIGMSDLLAPILIHTINEQYWASRSFQNYTQNITGNGGPAAGPTSVSGVWSRVYLYALPNLNVILDKSAVDNATHYAAVANILKAANLGLATDSYDNIPYSDALQGSDNLNATFDTQESIYNEIFSLLDSAIAALQSADTSGFLVGSEDLVYDGDMGQWLRAAYTLKARYQLHLSKVNGSTAAANAALASIANGFTSNSDDFQIFYNESSLNPWYAREVLAKNTGNDHDKIGDQMVNYMNGTTYPFLSGTVTVDPRLDIYAEASDGSGVIKGYVSGGDGLSGDGSSANADFKAEGFYTNAEAPITLITYAEAMFIKAEAAFLSNGGTTTSVGSNSDAYMAYMEGINANMSKVGADGSDYMVDTSIDVGAGSLMLHHIMKEKYIANFLNPETYVDFRRYDFSADVFKDLELPADNAEGDFPGEWFKRATYPSTESLRNPENVAANQEEPTAPVWWDQ